MTDNLPSKTIEFLKSKWKNKCPMCGTGDWLVQGTTFQLMEFHKNATILGGPVMPVLPIICRTCSYVAFISPLVAGLIELDEKETGGKVND